jgi:hypothetical protein
MHEVDLLAPSLATSARSPRAVSAAAISIAVRSVPPLSSDGMICSTVRIRGSYP